MCSNFFALNMDSYNQSPLKHAGSIDSAIISGNPLFKPKFRCLCYITLKLHSDRIQCSSENRFFHSFEFQLQLSVLQRCRWKTIPACRVKVEPDAIFGKTEPDFTLRPANQILGSGKVSTDSLKCLWHTQNSPPFVQYQLPPWGQGWVLGWAHISDLFVCANISDRAAINCVKNSPSN